MFLWSLELSANQISELRCICEMNDREIEGLSGRCWLSGRKRLLREHLITHHTIEPKDMVPGGFGKRENQSWRITDKGRMVLKIIELDAKEFVTDMGTSKQITSDKSKKIKKARGDE